MTNRIFYGLTTYNVSKWLVNEFDSFAVENWGQFVEEIEDITFDETINFVQEILFENNLHLGIIAEYISIHE